MGTDPDRVLSSIVETLDMADREKSCLDGVPVTGFTTEQIRKALADEAHPVTFLEIVSHCPRCNAPMYGPKQIPEGQTPEVKRSCGCTFGTTPSLGERRAT
jgi:hypothetical protein